MRIALIVEGLGEVTALPLLYGRINTPDVLLKPVPETQIHPLATEDDVAERAARRCRALAPKRIDRFVVILDHENRQECPGTYAQRLEARIVRQLRDLSIQVAVVIKNRMFENWLVADLRCLERLPGLFPDARRVVNAVPAGNADGVNALDVLRRASGRRGSYDKVAGAKAICAHLDPGQAALNSRSFRRFLRVLGDGRYQDQSRQPNRES